MVFSISINDTSLWEASRPYPRRRIWWRRCCRPGSRALSIWWGTWPQHEPCRCLRSSAYLGRSRPLSPRGFLPRGSYGLRDPCGKENATATPLWRQGKRSRTPCPRAVLQELRSVDGDSRVWRPTGHKAPAGILPRVRTERPLRASENGTLFLSTADLWTTRGLGHRHPTHLKIHVRLLTPPKLTSK